MKRLVFCFDGTWNRLDSPHPTNVLITAESVLPLTPDGRAQLIFYDEGVGTDKHDRIRGGLFGSGLVKNLADAYRFLIFNYSPGDEIYVFGFSRGAYTARSFVGLLYACGIISRSKAALVNDAIELYKQRDDTGYYEEQLFTFRQNNSPYVYRSEKEKARRSRIHGMPPQKQLQISFLGVWDTVGALGIPARYSWLSWINKKHKFHNVKLSSFVKQARHAVAIDERRRDFAPTLWENLKEMNAASNSAEDAPNAAYQEQWFPGVHSSIGGGGDRRGLSDLALQWVLTGARDAGLVLDPDGISRVVEFKPDYKDHLECSFQLPLSYWLMNNMFADDRFPGPTSIYQVSTAARRRWLENPEKLGQNGPYRPVTLSRVADALERLNPADYGIGIYKEDEYDSYTVQRGDNLRQIAKEHLGTPNHDVAIYEANLDRIDDKNLIYPGQVLRLPRKSSPSSK